MRSLARFDCRLAFWLLVALSCHFSRALKPKEIWSKIGDTTHALVGRQQQTNPQGRVGGPLLYLLAAPFRILYHKYPALMQHTVEWVVSSELLSQTCRLLDMTPVLAIGAVNVGVHGLWTLAKIELDESTFSSWSSSTTGPPDLYVWMLRNFVSPGRDKARQERRHTVLLSGFSHLSPGHLSANVAALAAFGPKVNDRILTTPRSFCYFYLSSIFASRYFDMLLYERFKPYGNKKKANNVGDFVRRWVVGPPGALGASGAISALIALYCLEFPRGQIQPEGGSLVHQHTHDDEPMAMSNWMFVLGAVLKDLFPSDPNDRIGHGAHLGGYLYGALFYVAKRGICAIWKRPRSFRTIGERLHDEVLDMYEEAEELALQCLEQMQMWCRRVTDFLTSPAPRVPKKKKTKHRRDMSDMGNDKKNDSRSNSSSDPLLPGDRTKLDEYMALSRRLNKMQKPTTDLLSATTPEMQIEWLDNDEEERGFELSGDVAGKDTSSAND